LAALDSPVNSFDWGRASVGHLPRGATPPCEV